MDILNRGDESEAYIDNGRVNTDGRLTESENGAGKRLS